MTWSQRGSRVYYFRKMRVAGRWRKVYFGTGPDAEAAAQRDAERKARRTAARQQLLDERERYAVVEASVAELSELMDTMTRAALIVAGYYRHDRGPWRNRRTGK